MGSLDKPGNYANLIERQKKKKITKLNSYPFQLHACWKFYSLT